MGLHCLAAVRPCCCAPYLTRAYVKNVGRHLLHWSRSGPEGIKAVCVCEGSGYLAMPTVTSHTTKLLLLSPFTAHCVLFTWRSVILWEGTIEISSEVKFRGLSYPSESLGNSHAVCLVKPIPSRNSVCFHFRYLHVKRQQTIAVRLWPLSVVHEPLKRYSGIDFSSLSLCSPAGLLLVSLWFSVRTFQSGVTLKIIDMANVFTAVSAVTLDENNRWFICLRTLSQTSPIVTYLPVKSSKPMQHKV